MSRPILTQEYLRSLFDYDAETGVFTRLKATGSRAKTGAVVGTNDGTGYLQTSIQGKKYRLHRLAYLYVTGFFPADDIDHKDRNRSNNAWANLRSVTRAENTHNKGMSRSNTSGFLGVSWVPGISKWESRIGVAGKSRILGYHATPEAASAAYLAAKAVYHPTAPL